MATDTSSVHRLSAWPSAATEADWEALYAEHLPRVYNFLRYRVGPAEAEDLAARVFEKAWVHRRRYRRDLGAFATWLLTIARNEAVDHLRRRQPHEPLEAAAGVAAGPTPEGEALRRLDVARLGDLVKTLGARELVALKFGAGLTNREIARQVGIGESNVGTILHRTIDALRRAWAKGDER